MENKVATFSQVSGLVKIHAAGCAAAKPTRTVIVVDAAGLEDLIARGYKVKTCKCAK